VIENKSLSTHNILL